MNNFLENQGTFKKSNVMSGNSMNKNEETYHDKSNTLFLIIFSESYRINRENFRKEFRGDCVYFKCFPGAKTKQIITLLPCSR